MPKRKTTEEFIIDANIAHDNKFNYSLTKYINNKTPVVIICPIHGEFAQRPDDHTRGIGCSDCGGVKKLNTTTFIEKAKRKHNNKFDYSRVKYINGKTAVIIKCPTHGNFKQRPDSHLRGQGCGACSGTKKLTTKEFIAESKNAHTEIYDYSKAEYVNSVSAVIVICEEHGEFHVIAETHMRGHSGCKKCAIIKKQESFIQRSILMHKNNYTYEKVDYKLSDSEVTISCKIHGDFTQTPNHHLKGHGCRKCSGTHQHTTKEFKKLCKVSSPTIKIEGEYTRGRDKIKCKCMICEHEWKPIADNISRNTSGCPECAIGGFKPHLPADLYLYNIDDSYLGFGITGDAYRRHWNHKYHLTNADMEFKHTHSFYFDRGEDAQRLENMLKAKFVRTRLNVNGFRTEAMSINYLDAVLLLIEREMSN